MLAHVPLSLLLVAGAAHVAEDETSAPPARVFVSASGEVGSGSFEDFEADPIAAGAPLPPLEIPTVAAPPPTPLSSCRRPWCSQGRAQVISTPRRTCVRLTTTALRGASFGGIAATAYTTCCLAPDDWERQHWYQRGPCQKTWLELGLLYTSIGVFAGTTIWDVADAGFAVKRVKAGRARKAQLVVAPSVLPGTEGTTAGLAASGRF